jgi:hypothetical protein
LAFNVMALTPVDSSSKGGKAHARRGVGAWLAHATPESGIKPSMNTHRVTDTGLLLRFQSNLYSFNKHAIPAIHVR